MRKAPSPEPMFPNPDCLSLLIGARSFSMKLESYSFIRKSSCCEFSMVILSTGWEVIAKLK